MEYESDLDREKLRHVVEKVIEAILGLFRDQKKEDLWKSRHGGAFCLADPKGSPEMMMLAGEVESIPSEKLSKYLNLCQEKARRLGNRTHDLSSWSSRNPDEDQWGGAVYFMCHIYSFSGLPEKGDEAAMLAVAVLQHPDDEAVREWASKVAGISKNPFFEPLLKKIDRPGFLDDDIS